MMTVSTEIRIRELIADKPEAARILMNHQIDFCENAKRSMEEVCRERRIAVDAILGEIDAAASRRPDTGRDWSGAPLVELMEHIVARHHGFLRMELPWAVTMARRVAAKHGEQHAFLRDVELGVIALREELESHLMKEERILFPYIASMERAEGGGGRPAASCFGTVANPIRMMEFEHDAAHDSLEVLRKLTGNYVPPPGSCLSFRILYRSLESLDADLHVHIDLENGVLHPAALALEQRVAAGA